MTRPLPAKAYLSECEEKTTNNSSEICLCQINNTSKQTVTILANQVVSLGEEVFEQSENITSIFVPADLVEDYKATADWRDYALKIKAIEN